MGKLGSLLGFPGNLERTFIVRKVFYSHFVKPGRKGSQQGEVPLKDLIDLSKVK